jgi:hypothetical protein
MAYVLAEDIYSGIKCLSKNIADEPVLFDRFKSAKASATFYHDLIRKKA